MVRAASWFVLAGLVACKGDSRSPSAPPPAPATALTIDAGVSAAALAATDGGITTFKPHNPGGTYAFDEMPAARPAGRGAARDRRPVEILLRSTPPGAIAAVDGVRIGSTPVLWEGDLTGEAREFTFVLAGHALARYRFVPVTSGIVHGTLPKITDDVRAQAPEIPPAAPPQLREQPRERERAAPPPPPPAPPAPSAPSDAAPAPEAAPEAAPDASTVTPLAPATP